MDTRKTNNVIKGPWPEREKEEEEEQDDSPRLSLSMQLFRWLVEQIKRLWEAIVDFLW